MNTLDLSIVVLNYNTSELLNDALVSIAPGASDLSYEVVVIDNASEDGGLACVDARFKNDPRFTFIERETNIGWAAINVMLARPGRYVATVDADARVHPGALQTLVRFLDSHPRAGAATAKLLNPDGSLQLYFRRILTPRMIFFTTILGRAIDKHLSNLREFNYHRYADLDVSQISEVEQPAWPCLVWRKEALGGMIADPDIPLYFVDVDMSTRVYAHGYKIYLVPDAVATHLRSTSFSRTSAAWRRHEYNRSIQVYLKKHYSREVLTRFLWLPLDRLLRWLSRAVLGREPLQ